jgi:Group II intron, maturase-specific domain
MRKRGTQKYYVYTTPSRKAVKAIKDKVKAKTYRSTRHTSLEQLITSLNQTLAGWANYFRHGVSKATFSAIDHFTWGRLMRWIRAKYAGRQARNDSIAPPLLRPAVEIRLERGRPHRRIQRHREALPLPRQPHPGPMDPATSSRQRLTSEQDTWSARCVERRTPGAGGGPRETTGGNAGNAPTGLPHHDALAYSPSFVISSRFLH